MGAIARDVTAPWLLGSQGHEMELSNTQKANSTNCRFLCMLFLLVSLNVIPGIADAVDDEPVESILFGSCIRQDKPMPIFKSINQIRSDLFIFLGDNIYADTDDMKVMKAKYSLLAADSGFSKLVETKRIMATWDDHDYGKNDAGAEYIKKEESQKTFLDFWNEPKNSVRRKTPGIYDAKSFGPEGKRLQVILLDTRFFRGPLKMGKRKTGGPYYPTGDKSVRMLGESQWGWLEEQFRKPAEIRIVASSIQLIAESDGQETWSNIPHERERFFDLIRKTKANGVVVISGDRHWSELSCYSKGMPYTLYDFTSSSLNQPHGRGTPTINKHRAIETTHHQENFGQIKISWDVKNPKLSLQVRDINGKLKIGHDVALSELKAN